MNDDNYIGNPLLGVPRYRAHVRVRKYKGGIRILIGDLRTTMQREAALRWAEQYKDLRDPMEGCVIDVDDRPGNVFCLSPSEAREVSKKIFAKLR